MAVLPPRGARALTVLLLLLAVAGCGGGAAPAAAPVTAVPASPQATPAPPTSPPAPPTNPTPSCLPALAGTSLRSAVIGGVTRQWRLTVPDRLPEGPVPVVVSFHGYGQSAAQQDTMTGLPAATRAAGVVLLTPEGVAARWNFPRRAAIGPDDVAFTRALLATVPAAVCRPAGTVLVTGISDGGDMAVAVACAAPSAVTAVVAVAPSVTPSCPALPPTVVEVHGTADPIVPFGGGGGDRPPPFQDTEARSATARAANWAATEGCGTTATTTRPAADLVAVRWSCAGRSVELLEVVGGGHTWPGAAPTPSLGATTHSLDASAAVTRLALDPTRTFG
jgi:polyhydroxybutyrate depolymerase